MVKQFLYRPLTEPGASRSVRLPDKGGNVVTGRFGLINEDRTYYMAYCTEF